MIGQRVEHYRITEQLGGGDCQGEICSVEDGKSCRRTRSAVRRSWPGRLARDCPAVAQEGSTTGPNALLKLRPICDGRPVERGPRARDPCGCRESRGGNRRWPVAERGDAPGVPGSQCPSPEGPLGWLAPVTSLRPADSQQEPYGEGTAL